MDITARFSSRVKQLVDKAGIQITYTHNGVPTYDPDVGATSTSTNLNIKAFKTSVSIKESQSPNIIGKEASAFLLSGKDFTFIPSLGDTLICLGIQLSVVMVTEYLAGNGVAMFRIVGALG